MSEPAPASQPSIDTTQRKSVTCAECKRLKLRCDKKVPCATCTRRGCANVCPSGTLTKGHVQGKRLVLTDTRHLYDKMDTVRAFHARKQIATNHLQMRKRLNELQAAIATARAQSTKSEGPSTSARPEDVEGHLSQAFGTLTLGGNSLWFGPNAASDYFVFSQEMHEDRVWSFELETKLCHYFEDDECGLLPTPSDAIRILRDSLPPRRVAFALTSALFAHTAWMFSTVSRHDVFALLAQVYPNGGEGGILPDAVSLHDVALLYSVLSLACLLDPSQEPQRGTAHEYYHMTSLALTFGDVLERPSLQAIRTLGLISWFLQFADDHNNMSRAYALMGVAAQLCKSLGIHRDDSHWKLSDKEKQTRRRLVWDIVGYDVWVAESLGRPSHFSTRHFDARLPIDENAFFDSEGEWQQSFIAWTHNFASVCMLRALDEVFNCQSVSYAAVIRLDNIIRDFALSEALHPDLDSDASEPDSIARILQRAVSAIQPQKLLLFIHRGFFARAMMESPEDPLRSKFYESVLAVFRAAMQLTTTMCALSEQLPFCVRFPFLWSSAFSSSVMLASIVIRSPCCQLASAAWTQFDAMFAVFQTVSSRLRNVSRVMPSLLRLHEKAVASRASCEGRPKTPVAVDLDDTELAYMYGHTHVRRACRSDEYADVVPEVTSPATFGAELLCYLSGLEQGESFEHVQSLGGGPDMERVGAGTEANLYAAWEGFMNDMGIQVDFDKQMG